MIELYTWPTSNGRKPMILLEELGLEHILKPVKLNGEQFEPEFVKISPNSKIPVMIDRFEEDASEKITIFESGAIMIYLAEKTGKFLPPSGQERATVMQWLMFQMSGLSCAFGQAAHYLTIKEKVPYALERHMNETKRLYKVLDQRLAESEYLGKEYSIADMAIYPWAYMPDYYELSPEEVPNVTRWIKTIGSREAVKKTMAFSF